MKKHMVIVTLVVLAGVMLLVGTVAYTLDFTQMGLIKTFGKTTRKLDATDAGLGFKWPWPVQRLVRYDARTFILEDPFSETETSDKQNILVSTFCAWRIADPVKLNSTLRTITTAEERLRSLLQSAKNDVVGRHDMEDFVNTDPKKMLLERIEGEIAELVSPQAERLYGIQIRMVGIKRLGLPEDVAGAVIDAMKEERQKVAQQYRSDSEAQATAIRERANSASKQIVEFASRKAAEIRSEGDRAAAEIYKQFRKNERLAMFLRILESTKIGLQNRSVILLDASMMPGGKFFLKGPSLPELSAPAGDENAGNSASPAPKGKNDQNREQQ